MRTLFSHQIQTRAVSSVYGKIEYLLLAYPGGKGDVTKENIIDRYGKLFEAFRDRVTFVVLGHFGKESDLNDQAKIAFEEALKDSNLDHEQQLIFCHTPNAGNIDPDACDQHSEFIQDPFVVMESETGHTILLESIEQVNPENDKVAEQLAAHTGFFIQPTLLKLEGGNILVGDDFALVGENTFHDNLTLAQGEDLRNPKAWLSKKLKALLGVRYILWIGEKDSLDLTDFHSTGSHPYQPFFHLDLFLTLTSKTKDGDEGIYVGKINPQYIDPKPNPEQLAQIHKIHASLDSIATFLEGSQTKRSGPRFEVHRLEMGGIIKVKKGRPCFIPYSYNNAHIERYAGVTRAYFPRYDHTLALEDNIQKSKKAMNIERCTFVPNAFDDYAGNKGSLHCITKVLRRAPSFY